MKKPLINSLFLLFGVAVLFGQVGIDTTNPQAQLDIRSSNQSSPSNTDGILIPKVDDFPSGVGSNQDAMMVYLTTISGSNSPGFYYYNHATTNWFPVGQGADRINNLLDAKSDDDGTNNGSSIFLGINAGTNDDGSDNSNIGIGFLSLNTNTSGAWNTAIGDRSLQYNLTGNANNAFGRFSLYSNNSGTGNNAMGYNALRSNSSGSANIAIGNSALLNNNNGANNTALGTNSLQTNSSGNNNVAIGYRALYDNSSGSNNIAIGNEAGFFETGSNKLYIENSSSATPLIYGDFSSDFLQVNGTLDINGAYSFPLNNGLANQVLVNNGAGQLVWLYNSDVDDDSINNLSDGKTNAGNNSIFFGQSAGLNDSGSTLYNIGIGPYALEENTAGEQNIAIGNRSLESNTDGDNNVAIGDNTLTTNTSGSRNTGIGTRALNINDTGTNNTAVGYEALRNNDNGSMNASFGYRALSNNTTGTHNTAIGGQSLQANTTGFGNIAIGWLSLFSNSAGVYNVAAGVGALRDNNNSNNVALGFWSLLNNANGNRNVAIGNSAGLNNVGSRNIFLGNEAGTNETGSDRLYIESSNADANNALIYGEFDNDLIRHNGRTEVTATTDANGSSGTGVIEVAGSLRLDGNEIITNTNSPMFLQADNNGDLEMDGGTFRMDASTNRVGIRTASPDYAFSVAGEANLNEGLNGVALRVNSSEALWYNGTYFSWGFGGQYNRFADEVVIGNAVPNVALDVIGDIEYTGTITDVSDKRLKENFAPINSPLEKLLQLKGYTYNMIDDDVKRREYGVIAQDVQKLFPEMVSYIDKKKDYLGVSYMQLIPVLIESVKEQQRIIESQKEALKDSNDKYQALLKRIEKLESQQSN